MAGNSVILKVALQTPRVAERYAAAFAAAGLPDGVFQYLHADHDQVASMIRDPRIAFVAFTGSVAGGHAVQQAAAERFIATNLELGGKDPAYVRPDAPLEATIDNLVDGAYFNAGQSCCAVERIYVHQDVYRDFVDGVRRADAGHTGWATRSMPRRRWGRWCVRRRQTSSAIRCARRPAAARAL